jgi:hypothetical protein
MEYLNTVDLLDLFNGVSLMKQAGLKYGPADVPGDLRSTMRKGLQQDREKCRRLGLHYSVIHIDHILDELDRRTLTFHELGTGAGDELLRRIMDELSLILFLRVLPDRAPYYREPSAGWEDVLSKFPSIRFDLEEAGKCFALNRYTACVFHGMRILEIGLTALGHHYRVSADRANWHEVITAIEKKVRALGPNDGANWRDEQQFGSEACTEFRHFKDAWRNHAMHVRQTFDDERSRVIYEHVRAFMAHLATRLKERK